MPRPSWPSASPWSAAWHRCRSTAPRNTPSGCSSTPRPWPPRSVGIDEVADAIQKGNVNLPTGTLWGRYQAFTVQTNGQLKNAAGLPAPDRGLPQRLARAAGRPGPGHRQRRERQGGLLVQQRARPSSWPSSASRAPTRWRWCDPSRISSRASGPRSLPP